MQDPDRRSPLQIFTGSTVSPNEKHFKPFGAPVYVLDSRLQNGQKINKWGGRARIGIYLGKSPFHNQNVSLIMDKDSGYVSPQFHIKVDSGFYTMEQQKVQTSWQISTGFASRTRSKRKLPEEPQQNAVGATAAMRAPEGGTTVPEDHHPPPNHQNQQLQGMDDTVDANEQPTAGIGDDQPPTLVPNRAAVDGQEPTRQGLRQSTRVRRPTQRLIETMAVELCKARGDVEAELFSLEALQPTQDNGDLNPNIYAMKASTDPDTMYWHQAMKEDDCDHFQDATEKEVKDQFDNGNFSIMERHLVPEGSTILPTVWQMRRKRDIMTRKVKKYKARLNIDGSRMKPGVHYDQTYAPVASWSLIRLLLTLAARYNWYTVQIDYVLAFPQAPVEREIYMEVPKGFRVDGKPQKEKKLCAETAQKYLWPETGRKSVEQISREEVNR